MQNSNFYNCDNLFVSCQISQKADGKDGTKIAPRKSAMSYRSGTELVTPIPSDPSLLSPLEQQLKMVQEIDLVYRQDQLLARIEEMVVNFDAELRLLRHDKFNQDVDLKNADLRWVSASTSPEIQGYSGIFGIFKDRNSTFRELGKIQELHAVASYTIVIEDLNVL